ncbi:MAG TPA: 5'/3'-nucleotidase SurE [Polyangiales bacterium]
MTTRPLILLSNDDGVHAEGVRALRAALMTFADVFTVAPEHEQSATSHRITLHAPLRHRDLGDQMHAVDGSPADCIYVALNLKGLLPRRPDLVVSGINHGFNLGMDVIYSGTVAAAREGALRGITALAISADPRAQMARVADHACQLVTRTLSTQLAELRSSPTLLLNVNYPKDAPRGVLATRLGRRDYEDTVEARTDPRGRSYYWIGGPVSAHDSVDGVDTAAVDNGFVSITPLSLEMTQPAHIEAATRIAGSGPEGT